MSMPKSVAEIDEVEIKAGVVINGVDSPHLMSVDSTEPIQTDVDEIEEENSAEKEKKEELKDKVENKEEEELETKAKPEKKKVKVEIEPDDSKKVKVRIGKLTKQWRSAERERDYEKEKRLELEKRLKELEAKVPASDKPDKADYEDEDEYIEALVDWRTETKLKASRDSEVETIKDKDEREAVKETYAEIDEVMTRGEEKYEDFKDLAMDEDLILSTALTQIALDSDVPEDILYYLVSNPDESARLSNLDPVRAAKEIGKIESRLEKSEEEEEEKISTPLPIPKKQSKAPAPINPVRTDGVTEKDPNKMSAKEYRAWRESKQK